MIPDKLQLVNRTYQRDGAWYTLAVIDRTNQIERLATDEEVAAVSPPAEVPAVAASVEAAVAETSAALRDAAAPRKKPGRKPKA